MFQRTWSQVVQKINRSSSSFLDILYLGYCNWPWICSFYVDSCLVRPMSPLLAHAYILHREGYEKMRAFQKTWGNRPIHFDKFLCKIPSFRKYAVHPILAYQSKNPALMTKLTDQWNITISNYSFLTIFHWMSMVISLVLILICMGLVFRGGWWIWRKGIAKTPLISS